MKKKQMRGRIKDLEEKLRESVARNVKLLRENRRAWAAYDAVQVERCNLEKMPHEQANHWRKVAERKDRAGFQAVVERDELVTERNILTRDLRDMKKERDEYQAGYLRNKAELKELRAKFETVTAERDTYGRSIDNWKTDYYKMADTSEGWKLKVVDLEGEATELRAMVNDLAIAKAGAKQWRDDFYKQTDCLRELRAKFDDIAADTSWKDHAMKTAVYADELRAENADLKKQVEALEEQIATAHRWKTYADSIKSQIDVLQGVIDRRDAKLSAIETAAAEWSEAGSSLMDVLLDGDE